MKFGTTGMNQYINVLHTSGLNIGYTGMGVERR